MNELIELIITDIQFSFGHFEIGDFTKPALYAFWVMIWLFPLKGVDRNDRFAALDFICFLCFAATIVIFVLPQSFDKQAMDWKEYSTTMMFVIFLSTARWVFLMNNQTAVAVRTNIEKGKPHG